MTLQSEDMGKLVAGADGWIEWSGGLNPAGEEIVEVRRRDGRVVTKYAGKLDWLHGPRRTEHADIIAFRPAHREAQPETDGGGDEVALEPGVPWSGEDPRWDDVTDHWRKHADEACDENGLIDLSEVDTCVGIALHRAFTLAALHPTPEGQTEGADREAIATAVFDCPEIRGEFDMATARKVADYILAALASKGV